METKDIKVIGSKEWCIFKELGIPAIKARVDSGAKTSSIQANKIKIISKGTEEWVHFEVHPIQNNKSIVITCETRLHDKRDVKNSSGISEQRFVIKTPVTIGDDTFEIEITLANRDAMEFKMLLGREALIDRYMVNPSESYLQQKISKKEIQKKYVDAIKDK
ncbi:ATP-dependent zinc protease family protein [Aquimarina latercula]|uniref:ATP-dependent zinc protease family protein n=1 Tax=Aquimarina latercula TaxID=987 RepID=UPI000428D402|nr:RimK/LysX family protein [Aquimarina latercula]